MVLLLASAALLAATALAVPAPSPVKRQCPAIPASVSYPSNTKLPDPFTFFGGQKVETLADWECRQTELRQYFQTQELGSLGKVDKVTPTLSGTSLSIKVDSGSSSITFSVTLKLPSGNGPFPAIIAYGGASIPIPGTVATITFNNDDIAQQTNSGSRNKGKYFTLYGNTNAGAMIGWAWGVSRIIDAIELLPSTKIDPKRIGVTGCSRNGKGAIVAGAFDTRVALTIPQESGSGGAACWRVSDSEKSKGKNIQTASEIVGENVWFSTTFNSYSTKTGTLPFDHHELAGLVAPRGLFVIENDIDWLGPVSTNACMKVGRLIYKAAGVPDNMGFSQASAHSHCQFPSSQQADLTAFINRFLLGQAVSTANIEKGTVTANTADWITWTPPTLT